MTLFENAILFAVKKHSGMVRKINKSPYILHPLEVAAIVGTMSDDEELLSAAVLHDTVEDTDASIDEIKQLFGDRVAALVRSETEDKHREIDPKESWRIRKEESLNVLRNTSDKAVKILWLGDKLSNMRSYYRNLKNYGAALWDKFNQNDPSEQAWYYRTIDELLSDLKEYDAWKEYHSLVEQVFSDVKPK